MTRAQFSRHKGVHRAQVGRWIQAGLPLRPDGGIDPVAAESWLRQHVDPSKRLYCQAERASAQRRVSTARRPPEPQAPPAPPGCEHLGDNPIHAAIVAALPLLAYRMPRLAGAAAVASGAPREVGEAVFRIVAVGVMQEAANLLTTLNVPAPTKPGWSAADMWDPQRFVQPDWAAAAEAAIA